MLGPILEFDAAADDLREREFSRLAAAIAPTVESLRCLTSTQFRAQVAAMLERLGYELVTTENAVELLITKDENKFVVAVASPIDPAPTAIRDLARLHSSVVVASAAGGFFITARGFTPEAEAYAATAPLRLVDGPKLVASMKRSVEGTTIPDGYRAMCRQCGDIVMHRLDRAEAVPCRSGRRVAPTIAKAALFPAQSGRMSTAYTPPRQFSRYEVRTHNAKYQAKMRRQKAKLPGQ